MNSMESAIIIGGGASGLMAALTASERPERTVLLLERQARTGKKLLATGNGRCNLSNRRLSLAHYHGGQPEFARPALEAFDSGAATDYFRSLGLLTVTEASGRVYPATDSANSVADVLRLTLQQRPNVTLRTASEVIGLRREAAGFTVWTAEETFSAARVIVCAGGIRTEDFDPQTLQSRLCPGLYAAGEVLDIDGDCGGYNLQWAWASGRLAGKLLENV